MCCMLYESCVSVEMCASHVCASFLFLRKSSEAWGAGFPVCALLLCFRCLISRGDSHAAPLALEHSVPLHHRSATAVLVYVIVEVGFSSCGSSGARSQWFVTLHESQQPGVLCCLLWALHCFSLGPVFLNSSLPFIFKSISFHFGMCKYTWNWVAIVVVHKHAVYISCRVYEHVPFT